MDIEFEIWKIPLYEAWADEVVRLHDEETMGWAAIARGFPVKISPEYVAVAYKFGKTGDPYGHRAKSNGDLPPHIRRAKVG
ncbi:MAG TPA: hypothetical protein PKN33_08645 [Phycisphaerae bacterium]|nr:hypothetical protein [Phycisphaerae bacterium]